MPATRRSRTRIETRLASLEATYGSFPVSQTTLGVSADSCGRARERCGTGLADVYVAVYNEAGEVLLVRRGDTWELPYAEPATGDRLEERARREVREATGVRFDHRRQPGDDHRGLLDRAEPDSDPVYRLVAVLSGRYVEGSPGEAVEWRPATPASALPIRSPRCR